MTTTMIVPQEGVRQRVAAALVRAGVAGVNFEQPVKFKSGILSPFYMNCRLVPGNGEAWRVVSGAYALHAQNICREVYSDAAAFNAIAGIQTGAIPFSCVLSYYGWARNKDPLPHFSIKKEEKGHGVAGMIDGGNPSGKRVLLIEDMITTNGSVWRGVEILRSTNAEVLAVVATMSYDLDGANQKFEAAGIPLGLLVQLSDVLEAMQVAGKITPSQRDHVLEWRADPNRWYGRWMDGHRPAQAA